MSEANVIKATEAANLCQLAVVYYLMGKTEKGNAALAQAKARLS